MGAEKPESDVAVEEPEVTDAEATDEAIKDSEPKTYTQEQFNGLLRDKQASDTNRQAAQADAAAARETNEALRLQNEELKKPKPDELSEEDADEPVSRRELHDFGRKLVLDVTKSVSTEVGKTRASSLKEAQATDAQSLIKTHTTKVRGQGLDANAVLEEGAAYLRVHHPTQFAAAQKSRNFATELYDLSVALVPAIRDRVATRNNTVLAKQLDDSDNTPPGGGGGTGPTGEEETVLLSIIDGSMPEAELDKVMGRA